MTILKLENNLLQLDHGLSKGNDIPFSTYSSIDAAMRLIALEKEEGTLNELAFFAWFKKMKKAIALIEKEHKDYIDQIELEIGELIKEKGFESIKVDGIELKLGSKQQYIDDKEIDDEEYLKLIEIKKEVDERIEAKLANYKELATSRQSAISRPNPFKLVKDTIDLDTTVPVLKELRRELTVKIPKIYNKYGVKIIY